jgi:hypothetical protein
LIANHINNNTVAAPTYLQLLHHIVSNLQISKKKPQNYSYTHYGNYEKKKTAAAEEPSPIIIIHSAISF